MPRDPNNPRWGFQPVDPKLRFMEKVAKQSDGCWLWTGTVPKNGYGRFGIGVGQSTWAHRASWLLFRGPIPMDRELDHLCRVRRCVNPAHLEPVTHLENVRRGVAARGPFCKRGLHDLSVSGSRNSKGACRLCANAHMRGYQAARREAKANSETFLLFVDRRSA